MELKKTEKKDVTNSKEMNLFTKPSMNWTVKETYTKNPSSLSTITCTNVEYHKHNLYIVIDLYNKSSESNVLNKLCRIIFPYLNVYTMKNII